ncbi:MAG: preprotein translocase subunit SecY [Oscillospiraceae bacterium]
MFQTLKNAWKLPDLRKKIVYTLMILMVFRIGAAVPVPFLDPTKMEAIFAAGSFMGYLNVIAGGALQNATLFALSISPYITSSIVIQLLTIAIPYLENLAKEGEDGRKKLTKITRYTTVALAVLQAFAYFKMISYSDAVLYKGGVDGTIVAITVILTLTAGAMVVVWLGEQIDKKGIGNGISLILFAGIVSRGPAVVLGMYRYIVLAMEGATVPAMVVLFIVVIGFIVVMTNAERRIPVQYAKRVVGRKMYGGQSSHIPIKVNMSGVMPIIFASSLLSIPSMIAAFTNPDGWFKNFLKWFNYDQPAYAVLYLILIVAFSYFYIAITYNPVEMANNLRKNNGGIPGIRPGAPTSEYIARIIGKITIVGAVFLGVIAILPIGLGAITKMDIALGGTTVIIVVGVALDTVRQLESQMMMRHYKGFLE